MITRNVSVRIDSDKTVQMSVIILPIMTCRSGMDHCLVVLLVYAFILSFNLVLFIFLLCDCPLHFSPAGSPNSSVAPRQFTAYTVRSVS